MKLQPPSLIVDGFPVAVTSDLGYANDTSDMGTGVARRRAWTQGELDRIARRARLGVSPSRVGAPAARPAAAPAAPAASAGGFAVASETAVIETITEVP
jgi:hypothetical protein